jgi:hypothetical protein
MQNCPDKTLVKKIAQIKKYLADTAHLGIVLKRSGLTSDAENLSGYVDAAFATEEKCASRIGYFFFFRKNLVAWSTENVKRVVTSSTEAECRGLSQFTKENLWHRQFHTELGLYPPDGPTTVYEDNKAAILMAENPGVPHKRSKHFGIEWCHFKESVELGEIMPTFVPTDEQIADMLTKELPVGKFSKFRDMMMGDDKLQNYFEVDKVTHFVIEGV